MNKKPWLAALLNLLLFGGGYLYLGRKKGFGMGLILAWILVRIGEITIYLTNTVFNQWLVLFAGLVVFMITFAVDGYEEAVAMNSGSRR